MTLPLDSEATAAITSDARGAHWLIEMDFANATTLRYTTCVQDILFGGNTYTGLGHVLDVSAAGESEEPGADELTLTLTVTVTTALLAALVTDVESYRGREIRLYLQVTDATSFVPAGAAVHRWTGRMEPARVRWDRGGDGDGTRARIELPCIRGGASRRRRRDGLRLSHAQQQVKFPGDMGLEYLHGLTERPALWLSKRFQEI